MILDKSSKVYFIIIYNCRSYREEWDARGMCNVWGKGGAYTGVWWGNLRERDHMEDSGVDGRIILRWIFRKGNAGAWTESSWRRIGTDGGHLWMRFHKMRGISWLAENLLASQEGLCSAELRKVLFSGCWTSSIKYKIILPEFLFLLIGCAQNSLLPFNLLAPEFYI